MFESRKLLLVFGLALALAGLIACAQYIRADCNTTCYNIATDCLTDAQGKCDVSDPDLPRCYKWEVNGQTVMSCWTCGGGNDGAASGWCIIGDNTTTCTKKSQTIGYRRYRRCYETCTG